MMPPPDTPAGPQPKTVHATCVAWQGRAVLITGPSGSGKSGLALQLMALGADLVADDKVILTQERQTVIATAPEQIKGLIEARGVGLLNATDAGPTALGLIIDLSQAEPDRLPPLRVGRILGMELPLMHKVESASFPAAILQYLKSGRRE